MDKGDACEICGGTESNLVDGFYYCMECGTQDTDVRETLVEHNTLADGTYAIAAKQKISRKLKEGEKMSAEWYKWHTLNFVLAGLTRQLVALGAEPSVKMKVLWIWTRYIKKFQKNDQKKPAHMFSKLEVSSESEASSAEAPGPPAAAAGEEREGLRRVTRSLLAALLALALNLDRSALQPSHLLRLVLHRLLHLNGFQRLVPADVHPAAVPDYGRLCAAPLSRCARVPAAMGRLARRLALGPPRTPDVEAVLADRLRELCLPPGLARLVLAIMDRAPIPFVNPLYLKFNADADRHPDYEAVVTAYVLVALKMCFGLDDDRERRLSDAVDRLNAEREAERLFSPRAWLAHLQFREAALSAHYAPLARERNLRADDYALVEHFEEHAYAGREPRRGGGAADARAVADRVAMDLLRGIPAPPAPRGAPPAALQACMGARAPHAALAELVAAHARDARTRTLLREDFTRHSAEYAYRALALPGAAAGLFEGVAAAGKALAPGPDRDYMACRSDPTVVHVRNCENENWFRTRRPTAAHVVGAGEPEPAAEPDAADFEERREQDPETFREEAEGECIFDDDFRDLHIKEEIKIECDPESFHETRDPEDHFANFDGFDENVDREGSAADAFDSDDERPRHDPAAFDRRETIRRIMVAAYREFKTYGLPLRFRDEPDPRTRQRRETGAPTAAAARRPRDPACAARRRATVERVQGLVDAYCRNLRHDVLHQVATQVRAFVDDADQRMEAPDAASDRGAADADRGDADRDDASSTDTRDVRVVGDSDGEDATPGFAEDPLYRGDARFDEREHDARQLYVRLTRAPPDRGDDDDDDDGDDDVEATKILDEKIAAAVPRRRPARAARHPADLSKIEHLVDSPERIGKFNYWVTHYTCNFRKDANDSAGVQRSLHDTLPRGFRRALREAARALRLPPARLYRRLQDVEDALLAAAAAAARPAAARRARRPKTREESAARDGPARKRARSRTVAPEPTRDDEEVDDDVASAIVFF